MCCFSKEELDRMVQEAKERKKLKEALKDIKPSDFEREEKKKEKAVVVK